MTVANRVGVECWCWGGDGEGEAANTRGGGLVQDKMCMYVG